MKIERQFHEWLRECHETYDKQVKFCGFEETISRPEITVKRQQSPWAVFKAIEWDGKVFKKGQLVKSSSTLLGRRGQFGWKGQKLMFKCVKCNAVAR